MTHDEVIRRLRALMDMPPEKRPIPMKQLEKLAGVSPMHTYQVLRGNMKLQAATKAKYEYALTMLENDRFEYKRVRNGSRWAKNELILKPAKPPCVAVSRIRITKAGPIIERVAVNPRAFPVLPEINRKA